MFNLDLITNLPTLERIDGGEYRLYKKEDGTLYPSVTSVIGAMSDSSWLDDWKSRVGEEEAKRVSGRATKRGSIIHQLCEDLVLNKPIDLSKHMPINVLMFRQLEKIIKKSVNNIRGSELFLYSDKLKIAGACDLVADFNNKKSIIDFKTSNKPKSLEDIAGYFLQVAIYCYMLWERTGIMHQQLVVLICVEQAIDGQIFVQDVKDWIKPASEICKKFHKTNF